MSNRFLSQLRKNEENILIEKVLSMITKAEF